MKLTVFIRQQNEIVNGGKCVGGKGKELHWLRKTWQQRSVRSQICALDFIVKQ